jgi:hypothetical protein
MTTSRRDGAERLQDPGVGAAPADISVESAARLLIIGVGMVFEQRNATEDHARRAVAALHGVCVEKRLLHRMELPIGFQALDGGDLAVYDRAKGRDTGAEGRAVHENRARAALAFATAILRSC